VNKEEKVLNYYIICNKLKNLIRKGWLDWSVKKDRLESVAEHVYGVQMLAIAMYSEYKYDIDLNKVLYMLAVHELGETIIGDLTVYDISKDEKMKIEHDAVHKILSGLLLGDEIEKLFLEFDLRETEEAKFAYHCDKLECDIQCKLYDEENCVDLKNQKSSNANENKKVKDLLKTGMSWSNMWLTNDKYLYSDDKNFTSIIEYMLQNKINK